MGNQQRCCIIGDCCPPGSPAQRAAMEAWLRAEFPPFGVTEAHYEECMKARLDALFAPEEKAG